MSTGITIIVEFCRYFVNYDSLKYKVLGHLQISPNKAIKNKRVGLETINSQSPEMVIDI